MFVQISPNENDVTETLCSLNFASRVRGIELGPAKKQMDNSELLKYKQMVIVVDEICDFFRCSSRFCLEAHHVINLLCNLIILHLKVEKLKQDLKSKDNQVKKMEDTNYGLEAKIKEKDVKNRNLQDKVSIIEIFCSFRIAFFFKIENTGCLF